MIFEVGVVGIALDGAAPVLQLFAAGTDNAIGGTGSAADVQFGSDVITPASGAYLFTGALPGKLLRGRQAAPASADTPVAATSLA